MGDKAAALYRKGVKYERRAKAELEEAGWVVIRSAGSKGGADLVAIKVRQIQVKATNEPRGWAGELEEMRERLPAAPGMTRELWVWNRRQGWEKHKLEDEGEVGE